MATGKLVYRIRFRWWFWLYIHTLAFLCRVFDAEPRWDRVRRVIDRAIKLERVNGNRT